MTVALLSTWKCDVCEEPVSAKDGYVIWGSRRDRESFDFKIIHRGRCDDSSFSSSYPLEWFLGAAGAVRLTAFLSIGPLKLAHGESDLEIKSPLTGWVDFFRRVQVPRYEDARQRLFTQRLAEELDDWNEIAPYLPDALERIGGGSYD
ncbi:hypothetical protein [Stenotrophomonas maltophilia]|uniref:hypothetical protein n=1 Tax=Stenotrophomonas maltophilia TaxID=40324 RepID=UPI0013D94DCB|nr:hypothetical protein [Stenotrophomonas maltophilia]